MPRTRPSSATYSDCTTLPTPTPSERSPRRRRAIHLVLSINLLFNVICLNSALFSSPCYLEINRGAVRSSVVLHRCFLLQLWPRRRPRPFCAGLLDIRFLSGYRLCQQLALAIRAFIPTATGLPSAPSLCECPCLHFAFCVHDRCLFKSAFARKV